MKALVLADAKEPLVSACAKAGLDITYAASVSEGRSLALRGGFDLVEGRLAPPLSLEAELRARLEDFFSRLRDERAPGLYQAVMREVEKPLIEGALRRAKGVRSAAAAALGIDRGTLSRRMRALGLDR